MTQSSTPISLDDQRTRIEQVIELVAERVRAEAALRASQAARDSSLAEQLHADRQRLLARHQAERAAAQSQQASTLAQIIRDYELAVEKGIADHDQSLRSIATETEQATQQAQAQWDKRQDRARAEYQATVHNLQVALQEFKARVEERRLELRELEQEAERVMRRRRCWKAVADLELPDGVCDVQAPLEGYPHEVARAKAWLARFGQQWAPKFLASGALLGIFMLVWAAVVITGIFMEKFGWPWLVAGGAVALAVIAINYVILRPIIVRQTIDTWTGFRRCIANADISLDAAIKLRAADADTKKIQAQKTCDLTLRQATLDHQKRIEDLTKQREERIRSVAETLQGIRSTAAGLRDRRQQEAHQQFSREAQVLQERQEQQARQADERQQQELSTTREMRDRGWGRLVTRWREGLAEFQGAVDQMWDYCRARCPEWESASWQTLRAPDESLPTLQFGHYGFSLASVEGGIPSTEELQVPQSEFKLPAVVSFGARPSLLLEAWGTGRTVATRAMQNVMLRLLTTLPPGKVRFTIIDPVGLGQNFSAFMHLADFDEKLITHRIWTESQHIQQRLADLTEHMENVIQTYLRNEFPTIDEYNRQAGEVSEPFHVLVVANFPAGFTDDAAQRLMSIVHSGARCGVYSIISTDSKIDLPRQFDMNDLESHATTVQWNGQRFAWREPALKHLPLTLDDPPADERFTQWIREIGKRAKDAIRVEVPFATVACADDAWWKSDSRGGIEIALGRAGASKLQYLRLGKGTSQHVLISGKTGSGKSTLLHAMITNMAIHYSPHEVEFYLIDFKKGVEFKPYAALKLPHARVIAIESEREFGMSVLERLDQELRVRGDLFRQAGVQDIRNYRDMYPDRHLPRVLLMIDEFQEFFTQDDKVAQEAALLLDRLVRQGRAFGVHVLLGSQTLAGAYSLARSTLGQMAIRIALQCSEADSHLILSEDNTAARLLNRPGEAIYNDANGLFEGNHPFQVVWLSAGDQERYLTELASRAERESVHLEQPIVFEGNAPADPAGNELLHASLEQGAPREPIAIPRGWLGSAVAIKDPTSALFRRQSGANLLVVGQQEESALGMLATAVVSLAASVANGQRPKFIVLDGTRPEAPEAGWWRKFAEQLPLDIVVATANDAGKRVAELAAESQRRLAANAEGEAPIFLLVYNLARFRDLRRSEDDLGFGGFGEEKPASVSKQFAELLRDAPGVGIHTLLWADTFNTVNRWFERSTVRELDQRVLFQMSANDSSNLMDSPAASRLGAHRAILYSEEAGSQEKFRPYGPPEATWLKWVAERLAVAPPRCEHPTP